MKKNNKRKVRKSSLKVIIGIGYFLNLAKERGEASRRYKEFVHAGIKEESPLKAAKGQLFLGQENFIAEIKLLAKKSSNCFRFHQLF